MTDVELRRKERVRAQFEATLNQHGFGFQYSVLKAAGDYANSNVSSFTFEVAEFPVEVQTSGTRLDFVLRRGSHMEPFSKRPLYLLAECKRANPALSDWCFVRAPFTRRGGIANSVILDSIRKDDASNFFITSHIRPLSRDDFFQIGLDIRSEKPGEPSGRGRGAIEEAATQVLRGLNGFVEFLFQNSGQILTSGGCDLLPVIFTTANLWVTSTDLNKADLATGNVAIQPENFAQAGWLLYQYNQSPGLKYSSPVWNEAKTIGDLLESNFVRTVPIVSPQGLEQFFRWATHLDLW